MLDVICNYVIMIYFFACIGICKLAKTSWKISAYQKSGILHPKMGSQRCCSCSVRNKLN